jgi:hypothetical protein
MWAGIALAALLAADPTASPLAPAACPTQAEVDAELARLGAAGVTPPEIAIADGRMRVVLRSRDGTAMGSREVELPETCRERATVAAVLVATWMGIWPQGPDAAGAGEQPTGLTGNSAPRGANPASPATAAAPPAPAAAQGEHKVEYGLALAAALDSNRMAAGGAVEVRVCLVGPLYGLVGLTATTERNQRVGVAVAGYLRPALDVGVAVRMGRGRVQGEVGASGRLGLLIVRGKDLAVTHSAEHVAPGAAASLRLVFAGERFSPFVLGTSAYWFGQRHLTLDNDSATAELPRWDFSLGVGFYWAP